MPPACSAQAWPAACSSPLPRRRRRRQFGRRRARRRRLSPCRGRGRRRRPPRRCLRASASLACRIRAMVSRAPTAVAGQGPGSRRGFGNGRGRPARRRRTRGRNRRWRRRVRAASGTPGCRRRRAPEHLQFVVQPHQGEGDPPMSRLVTNSPTSGSTTSRPASRSSPATVPHSRKSSSYLVVPRPLRIGADAFAPTLRRGLEERDPP